MVFDNCLLYRWIWDRAFLRGDIVYLVFENSPFYGSFLCFGCFLENQYSDESKQGDRAKRKSKPNTLPVIEHLFGGICT